jgi:hypothetical protein
MFADQSNTIKALEAYFPTSWGYSVIEKKLGGKEAAKKWRENKLMEDLSKWLGWAEEQEGFVDALTRMRNLGDNRSKDEFEELKCHVLVISFFVTPGWYKPTDFEGDKIKKHKECVENITNQVKGIKRFRESLKFNKNNSFQSKFIHLGFSNRLEVLKKEGLIPTENKDLDHLSLKFLDWLLESYLMDLEMCGFKLDENNSEFAGGVFLNRNIHGALVYPQELPRQAIREHAEINSYIFHLAMIFRQFTGKTSSGPWLTKFKGEMPECGGARYENVADLANALFSPLGWFEDESAELTDKKVMERIQGLLKKDVRLGSWLTVNF